MLRSWLPKVEDKMVQKIKLYVITYLKYHDADEEKTGVAFASSVYIPGGN